MGLLIAFAVAVGILLGLLFMTIRIVPEYKRVVVLRLGRVLGAKGPGVVIILPIIDQPVVVDQRETYLEIPRQTCITKDNAPISIDFLIY